VSDHFSGPRAIAGPAGDICDLYTFPSPERPGHLVLVLDVLPNATPDSHFSEAIVCRFRLRPVTIRGVGKATAFPFGGEDQELVFSCHFEAPQQGEAGVATAELCRQHGISEQTYYRWKAKYGGMDSSEAKRLKQLEDENRKLKHVVADLTLDNRALKDVLSKNW